MIFVVVMALGASSGVVATLTLLLAVLVSVSMDLVSQYTGNTLDLVTWCHHSLALVTL